MIEWGTGANKSQVECLTRLDDQEIRVRLSKRRTKGLPEFVVLEEPTAIEFATLRKKTLAADDEINAKFPRPAEPPDDIEGETDWDRATRVLAYQKEFSDWLDDRNNYRTDPDTAVYANVIIDAVNMLTSHDVAQVGLGDLTPECFRSQPLQALMNVWETPLGGAVSPEETTPPPTPPASTEPVAAPSNANDAPPSLDSPESTRSSDPGTEPSPPSPLPSSTT